MTAQLQLFMILGAVVLLLTIFALLKRGLMSATAAKKARNNSEVIAMV